ncbi:uncharacterized protein BXZ73DRAFT_79720 [Epithele typhae]|uniref:uncharacterized protein n=1 Tax=Epithele typhae TaxID=378194 RepID=UPI0020077D1D|nr:uncharacterized protein BXZ73DRAFT_79720 [Epithele typhae]KAH9922322.1 hypothetical protein BXZ73DRAFT_79720 [Epithele typhae]
MLDGFKPAKRTPISVPAPKFASAFDDPHKSKLTSKDQPLRAPPPPVSLSSSATTRPNSRSLHPPLLPIRLPSQPQAGPSNAAVRAPVTRDKPVHILRPPDFQISPKPTTKFTLPSHHKSGPARPMRVMPVPELGDIFLKPLAPEPQKPKRRKVKTITTTRVALALDPLTEAGSEELMALNLELAATAYLSPTARELNRGLGQSPEKASKKKTAKFLRGGLADRAQHLFAQQRTGLALWQKDMDLQAQRPGTHPRSPPDLSLRIIDTVHITSIASLQRSQTVPRLSIVRCAKLLKGSAVGEITVVLDFGINGATGSEARTLEDAKGGRGLNIWSPWNSSDRSAEELRKYGVLPKDGTVLFCTRFRII